MSMKLGIWIYICFMLFYGHVASWWWLTEKPWMNVEPAQCPYEDTQSHICYTLSSETKQCNRLKCCGDLESNSDFENPYTCKLCNIEVMCSVQQCYTRCCDGYDTDEWGGCQKHTGKLQCKYGGRLKFDRYGKYECECPAMFKGRSCEIPECDCQNIGTCLVNDGKPYCNCTPGYYGDKCQFVKCDMVCENGGVCIKDGIFEYCKCPYPYDGKNCENANYKVTCDTVCENGGHCSKAGTVEYCRCPYPYTGRNCEEEVFVKKVINMTCSTGVIKVNTTSCKDYGLITPDMFNISAIDEDGTELEVDVFPNKVRHCYCINHYLNGTVFAEATNKKGLKQQCEMRVEIHDVCPPRYKSCPDDIYVFHDEPVRWVTPMIIENTIILTSTNDGLPNGQLYPEGIHFMEYRATDCDRNLAKCSFRIHVINSETPMEELPWQLMSRHIERHQAYLAKIMIPTVGSISLTSFICMVIFCYRQRKPKELSEQEQVQEREYSSEMQTTLDARKYW